MDFLRESCECECEYAEDPDVMMDPTDEPFLLPTPLALALRPLALSES
jgi:hypothetical protein